MSAMKWERIRFRPATEEEQKALKEFCKHWDSTPFAVTFTPADTRLLCPLCRIRYEPSDAELHPFVRVEGVSLPICEACAVEHFISPD